jgi:PAS domain S-box-containing protein
MAKKKTESLPSAGADEFGSVDEAKEFAQSIVETLHEPLLVLTSDLHVRSANPAFYSHFQVHPEETIGRLIYDLGNGQWDIPALRTLLEDVLPDNNVFNDLEVAHTFKDLGERFMLINARRLDHVQLILLGIRDITERKQAEAAVREGMEKYRTLFDSIDEGFCVFEMLYDKAGRPVDFRFVEVNPAFERHTGLTQASGRTILEMVPHLEAEWFEIYGRVASTGEPARFVRYGEGLQRWFDVYAFRLGNPENRRVAAIFTDVTERKQTEDALRASQLRLQRMINIPGVGVLTFRSDGTLIDANDSMLEMIGYSREQVQSGELSWRNLTPPEWIADSEHQLQTLKQTGCIGPYEKEYFHKDGSRSWMLFTGASLGDGTIVEYAIDIADRRRAELKIRQHEQRFRTLVEQILDYAIFMIDPDGRCTSWNAGVERVLGFRESEFLGQDVSAAIFTPEDLAAGVPQQELRQAAETGSALNDRWMRRKNGNHFFANGTTTALRDHDGELLGFMKVMRDQTEQKHLEEELRQLATELADGARRKDEFLALLAHELRNPLAPICTGLQLMQVSEDKAAAFADVGPTMQRQTEHMVTLIDDLLDVSRITRGKLHLRKFPVTLSNIVDLAVETSQPLIEDADHELAVSLPDEPVTLYADPHRLAQVLSNLLNNAAKYTPDGGHIALTAERQGDQLIISVKDDGIGIPADRLDSIFDLFSQVEADGEQITSGLGIGLTLVKSLVELHDGRIEAHSAGPGEGSEFRIWLPVHAVAPQEGPAEPAPTPETQTQPVRVLIVDDKLDVANMLSQLVAVTGHDVRTAGDGQQAIDVAEQFRPDVILMDLGMPRMDGYEAARRIRQQDWGRRIRLVALSGWGQESDKQRSKEAGFDDHLVKPPDPADLQRVLEVEQPPAS